MIAAANGHAQVVRMLIDANVNLEAANAFGCEASVRYLCIFADMFDDFRSTAVYWAAEDGHYKIVHMLAKVQTRKKPKKKQTNNKQNKTKTKTKNKNKTKNKTEKNVWFRCLNSCKSNYRLVLTYARRRKEGSWCEVVFDDS